MPPHPTSHIPGLGKVLDRVKAGVPADVSFEIGTFQNAQKIELATFKFGRKEGSPKAVIMLVHGYGAHSIFEWLLPRIRGENHEQYTGSIVDLLVAAGFEVHMFDHQSMGFSAGVRPAVRCFFNAYQDLVQETLDYCDQVIKADAGVKDLPLIMLGQSMGGCTTVRCAQERPGLFHSIVLYSPMLSLERVGEQSVLGPIKNKHIKSISGAISYFAPTAPVAAPKKNPVALLQAEFENPPCYPGYVRARVGHEFVSTCSSVMTAGSPISLETLESRVLTFHSVSDEYTDPEGSRCLMDRAASKDKTYVRIGKDLTDEPSAAGATQDLDVDMFHGISYEPGHEQVHAVMLAWVNERLATTA